MAKTSILNCSERSGLIWVAKTTLIVAKITSPISFGTNSSDLFYCEEKCKHCEGTAVIDYFLNVRRTGPLSAVFSTILNHHLDSYCC